MKLVRGAWKILVGIKDALVLIFMLLFFSGLFLALSARPNAGGIHDGALVLALNGSIVEQPEETDALAGLTGHGQITRQFRMRDLIRALDAARGDSHVKAVVLDLDRFAGGYPAAIAQVGEAIGRVRASGKPVLAYATAYTDSAYLLAANAGEIWVNPMGGVLFSGAGGSQLYYKGLMDKLGVNVHVYRVGEYKSAVEPYIRSDQSEPARRANEELYGAIFEQWQQAVHKARAKANLAPLLQNPDVPILAAGGDITKANLALNLVDKTGDRLAFGKRVAEIAGAPDNKPLGNFRQIKLTDFLAAHPARDSGDAIGVLTVAGTIVDGEAGPGTAGGDTVAGLMLQGLKDNKLKALVVRVDSPGGSALASEQIRQAVLQAKAQGLPVVVSMGSLAASGGYWVSTVGDTIFAEPNTITGSIGIFGVIPTFEKTLAKIGVTTDGVKTTPLTGQPDVFGGTNPIADRVLQAAIENGYSKFVNLVAGARHLTPARVNEIGQGHVWIGGTAHQIGLVDRFGGLDDAIAEAARRAKLDPAKVHPVYLEKKPSAWRAFLNSVAGEQDEDDGWVENGGGQDFYARLATERRGRLAQALGDARQLAFGASVQARCLECEALGPPTADAGDARLLDLILARLGQ